MAGQKKGLPIWAWFGIGCAVLLVVALVAALLAGMFLFNKGKDFVHEMEANPEMTVARGLVKASPDYEEVEVDPEAGTITVRNKKTGEVFTANVSELKSGRFVLTGEDGEALITTGVSDDDEGSGAFEVKTGGKTVAFGGGDAEAVPDWVPTLPDTEIQPLFSMKSDGMLRGSIKFDTDLTLEEVTTHFQTAMESAGFDLSTTSHDGAGQSITLLNGQMENPERTLIVNISSKSEETTTVAITYSGAE